MLAGGGPAMAQEAAQPVQQSQQAPQAQPPQQAQSAQPAQPAPQAEPDDGAAAASPVLQQAQEQLDHAKQELKRLADRVQTAKDDDALLAELKVQVDALSRQIIAASVATRPRLDEIKARLTELGDPPAEGQPPEANIVTEERERLLAERGAINALTGSAESLSVEARKLANDITTTRRELFSNTLLRHTDVSAAMLSEAVTATIDEAQALWRSVSSWVTFAWNYKRVPFLSAIFLSLCAALLFLVGGYRLFSPFILRHDGEDDPTYFRQLSVAFWSTLIPTMALTAFAASSYFFLSSFNVLRPDIAPILALTLGVGVALFFVTRLANSVLSPRRSSWRLVRVSNRGARTLMVPISAMTLVNGLDYLLGGISVSLGSPVILTVAKSFLAAVIIGLILMSMAWIRPVLRPDEPFDAPGRPWPRVIGLTFLLTGAALIAIALSGYVGLARFVATQIIMTGAILVMMYIGILTGRSVSKQGAFADTAAGRYLERRGLEQVALDQIGLIAGLGIYALVVLFFIPLVLLQWGFKVADIESWVYRVVTEIRIGTITISLVGILAGVLFFALGYVVTRWVQRWIDGNIMARSRVDAGVRNSIRTGIGYTGVGIAGLIAVSAAGIDLSSLALVAGALSLGVGFGLQNIVSNFVSGLILLVERPFKVGDWIVSGTTEGFVRRISVRATEIETFQHQSIMMPNSLLINASVGNWTHRNKLGRSEIAVTLTYASDPRRVIDLLHEIATAHPMVLKNPSPNVGFTAFGDERMTFELRIYVADVLTAGNVRNDIRVAIYERFRDEGIGAPFPMKIEDVAPEEAAPAEAEPSPPVEETKSSDEAEEGDAGARPAGKRSSRSRG
ncbi:mechanosensitive ion channel family protein [Sinorhizobium numidicum]|uniref:Mechanosensitive ion channel family protein n=1 Tax=Sinorhizobium numidicum TaxID=680248 RepID=A0ABY8D2W2_9HYPH|nr:mechanosensitive ion channel family protein [Sinorhizobium numidicum]WEX79197.1 mechanosensitive ion channel family protein [Sinorhizobium numidicum]WEX85219.1 mechanosensitive ion channel family protein [Sinorhizobium numidicum]